MGTLKIDILGTSFAISANEDDAYLKKLLSYYTRIAEEIEKSSNLKDSAQIAILSGIMICDELYKEKSKNIQNSKSNANNAELDAEAERLTIEMIKKIDQALK
jgi:cell division protein ZapA (FtsZ GTPase activity inhibitor)